jgi:hypothetical protein
VGQKAGTKRAPVKKSESQKPEPVENVTEEQENDAASSVETPGTENAEDAVDTGANENGSDGPDKAGNRTTGAGNSNGTSTPVKTLSEAGKKRLVNKLLGLADSQATQGAFKITPADLIRLMQLHREMNPQKDRKVTVQWIEDKPE